MVTFNILPVLGCLAAPPLAYPPYPEQNQSQITLEMLQSPQLTIQKFGALPLLKNCFKLII